MFDNLIHRAIFILVVVASSPALQAQTYNPPPISRQDLLLDDGWRFARRDVSAAEQVGFDDSSWTPVQLPHTWNNLDQENGTTNYYRGVGWYRRNFVAGKELAGREFFLKCDGAFLVSDLYVNGRFVGEHKGGFAAFVFDITPYVKIGGGNVLAIKVNNAANTNIPPLSADFAFCGGLYRNVHLLITDPVHISPMDYGSSGVYLQTTEVTSNSARLQITTVVSNAAMENRNITLRAFVTDASHNLVATLRHGMTISPSATSNVIVSTDITHPHLWDGLKDPYLYRVFVEVSSEGNTADLVSEPLGFRWFNVDPNKGFFLNGHYLDLHGVSLHQDWLDRGWAIGRDERLTNFALLKEIGATALRLSHYEHDDETYQLADQNGIILWSEIPLINRITESPEFYASARQQLRELIRQRYNHPAVVCWGIFNEITLKPGPRPTTLARQLAKIAAEEDPTRPSASAANASNGDPSNWCTKLNAFNKYFGWYNGQMDDFGPWADAIHRQYPDHAIGISEFGAGASIRQHSENPLAKPAPSGKFHPEEYQNLYHESQWQQLKARPYLWCKFVWTLCDFAVPARQEGDTPGRNDKGLVTYDRLGRKDAFYWYKANWSEVPMVYIAGHTFANRMTNAITAKVYSNCQSVDLYVNGISQGVRTSTNCIFAWPVALLEGTNRVEAIAAEGPASVRDSLSWIAPPSTQAVFTSEKAGGN